MNGPDFLMAHGASDDRATFLPEYSVSIGAQAGLSRQAV